MKTAIAIPDELFAEADELARRLKKSRSELYSQAVREYLLRHSPDSITDQLNKVVDSVAGDADPFADETGARILRRQEW